MATVTDSNLKELKDLITAQSSQLIKVTDTLTEIKINQARTEERLSGQIAALDEKVSGLDKRLDVIVGRVNGLTNWLIGVLFVLAGGLLGILGKITFFLVPNTAIMQACHAIISNADSVSSLRHPNHLALSKIPPVMNSILSPTRLLHK